MHKEINLFEGLLYKIEPAMVVGTAIYGAKAILDGRIQDVADLLSTNFLR